MTRLWLVRHAEPAAAWGEHDDPGLSTLGVRQADELAARLMDAATTRHAAIVSSPLKRAQETAAPLASRLGNTVWLDPRVGEIPTPAAASARRTEWLRAVLSQRWSDLDSSLRTWRAGVLDALLEAGDAVIASHFVAINAAVSAATGDDRVRCCSPAHTSVTELAVENGALRLVRLGAEAPATTVR